MLGLHDRLRISLSSTLSSPSMAGLMASSIFISHASEDKDSLVRPLAQRLTEIGLTVWYDEYSLRPGDSLRRSIDKGLAQCSVGVVVLSPSFFTKEWPQRELDALYSSEIADRTRIIPIWHQIDFKGVAAVSPLLADRLAISSSIGVTKIASKISALFPDRDKLSASELADLLGQAINFATYSSESHSVGVYHRFLSLNAFKEEFCLALDARTTNLDPDNDFPEELSDELKQIKAKLKAKHRIPHGVYVTTDPPVRESELTWWRDFFSGWSSGTLTKQQSRTLAFELDLAEMDEFYVLLNVPNYRIAKEHRQLLEKAMVEIGAGYKTGYKGVERICRSLRALGVDG